MKQKKVYLLYEKMGGWKDEDVFLGGFMTKEEAENERLKLFFSYQANNIIIQEMVIR